MASRQTIARLSDRIEALAGAPLRENRKTHYVCVGGTRAEWDACADRQIKELILSGKARNDDLPVLSERAIIVLPNEISLTVAVEVTERCKVQGSIYRADIDVWREPVACGLPF